MATFTSVMNGNWNDGTTQGKTSPGVKGTDQPGNFGDLVNISHVVNYNVIETNQLGTITINNNGVLSFATDQSTKLTMGSYDISVQSGGELRVGTSQSILPKQYTAELLWDNTTGAQLGVFLVGGSKVSMQGDPSVYGSIDNAKLASDWTGGKVFRVVGDFSSKQQVGQGLYVHKYNGYTDQRTDVNGGNAPYTIFAMSPNGPNTDITINEAAPGVVFKAGGFVVNPTRNIRFGKLGVNLAVGTAPTNVPRIYCNIAIINSDVTISNVCFSGVQTLGFGYYAKLINVVVRNVVNNILGNCLNFSGILIASTGGIFGNYCNVEMIAFANNNVTANLHDSTVIGTVFANNLTLNACNNTQFYVNAFCNNSVFVNQGHDSEFWGSAQSNMYALSVGGCFGLKFYGRVGYDLDGASKPNTNADFGFSSIYGQIYLNNIKAPVDGFKFTGRNDTNYRLRAKCQNYNQLPNSNYIFDSFGDIIRVKADGSNSRPFSRRFDSPDILEVIPLSKCSPACYVEIFKHTIDGTAGVPSIFKYYVQWDGTGNLPITLTGVCKDATDGVISVTSTQTINTRVDQRDWSNYVDVTITPNQNGPMFVFARMVTYEAARKLWIDPRVQSNFGGYAGKWMDGESVLIGTTSTTFQIINSTNIIQVQNI